MKTIFICYEYYFDGCNEWKQVSKVFDDEAKALVWKEDGDTTSNVEWRDYTEMEVE